MHVKGGKFVSESRKICNSIGLEKARQLNYVATHSFNVNPKLLKCPHSPVMYITIYPFAPALLNHTLLTTASASLYSKDSKAL